MLPITLLCSPFILIHSRSTFSLLLTIAPRSCCRYSQSFQNSFTAVSSSLSASPAHVDMSHSAHLIEAHERKPIIHPYSPQPPSRLPHPVPRTPYQTGNDSRTMDPNDTTWISQHGYPPSTAPISRFSQWSEEKVANLQARLSRKLGPEYVTQRPGPAGGPKLR